jgi:hypothetical protein
MPLRTTKEQLTETSFSLKINKLFKQYMDEMWVATEVDGYPVINRRVGYGRLPDIIITVKTPEGTRQISVKERYIELG